MNTCLGIELGSTRIKAVTIDEGFKPVSSGDYTWASRYENGVWTYPLEEAWTGLKAALSQVENRDGIAAAGVSAMMHGYLAFDKDWNLLAPFRTWQNTITGPAAAELTGLFGFNVPQRWSIAHLYQAVLNGEDHVPQIAHLTTLAGYIHYRLTGVNAIGIGEASGMFPIDSAALDYDQAMVEKFDRLPAVEQLPWKLRDLLPRVLVAGQDAGILTREGSALLDNLLPPGIPFAPAEGDAGTGMTGAPVAMVHCNNCTNDTNAWVGVLGEAARLFGTEPDTGTLYTKLYEKSLEGDPDCGGVLVCNYLAGEGVTHMDAGRPLVVRTPETKFTLANFFRSQLYSTMSTLKLGMDILAAEQVAIDSLTGHGGLFKTPVVGQSYMAAACNAPVTCMETAGEGGPYGMALLASFLLNRENGERLEDFLSGRVFAGASGSTIQPDPACVEGFNSYIQRYKALLEVEKTAVSVL